MFIVAISPLMFSPGEDAGVCRSIKLGVSVGTLMVDGPEALMGEGRALLSLAEHGDDDAEEPAPA